MQMTNGVSDATAVARDLLDVWCFEGQFHPDVQWYDPAMPQPRACGRAAVRALGESTLRAFRDFRYEILEPICAAPDGTRCAIPWRIREGDRASPRRTGERVVGHDAAGDRWRQGCRGSSGLKSLRFDLFLPHRKFP
jgi:hypothetical protein